MASPRNEAEITKKPPEGSIEVSPHASESNSEAIPPAEGNIVDAPDGKLERIVGRTVRRELMAVSYSGPMPPAEQMAQYDAIVPGAARIIVEEFQANGKHQREMERIAVTNHVAQGRRAQWMAFILVAVGFGLILWLAHLGQTTVACVVAGTLLIAVISGFLTIGRAGADDAENGAGAPPELNGEKRAGNEKEEA